MRIRALLGVLAWCLAMVAHAGVDAVTVRTQGRAGSLPVAINSALLEALGRVNGKTLSGHTEMASLEASETTNKSQDYYSSEAFARRIEQSTHGAVQSYRLLDKHREDGMWVVHVEARIAKFRASAASRRLKVAVVPVRQAGSSYRLAGDPVSAVRIRTAVDQSLADYLTQTRKFAVLDREYRNATEAEKNLIRSGRTPVKDVARLGQDLAADYVLVGTLTHFGYARIDHVSRASGRHYTTAAGRAVLDFRVINADTRQIAMSDTVTVATARSGLSADQATDLLSRRLGQQVARRIQQQIYPLMVVALDHGELILGQGGDTISRGDVYKLYEYGKKAYDPYTHEALGRAENYVGTVKVVRVTPKQAYAKVIKANKSIASDFGPRKYILREKVAAPAPDPAKKITHFEKKERQKLDHDSDW